MTTSSAPKKPKPITRLTEDDIALMFSKLPASTSGVRNRALIHLLWKSGLRISEALALRVRDVTWPDGKAKNGAVYVRRGKGGKARTSTLYNGANRDVREWLQLRATLGATDDHPIFCAVHADAVGHPMRQQNVDVMLKRLADRAGLVDGAHAHALRHAHAVELSLRGMPLPVIQNQLGHSSPLVTVRYLRSLGIDESREAAQAFQW
jgi:site-specific recombinase XerD